MSRQNQAPPIPPPGYRLHTIGEKYNSLTDMFTNGILHVPQKEWHKTAGDNDGIIDESWNWTCTPIKPADFPRENDDG